MHAMQLKNASNAVLMQFFSNYLIQRKWLLDVNWYIMGVCGYHWTIKASDMEIINSNTLAQFILIYIYRYICMFCYESFIVTMNLKIHEINCEYEQYITLIPYITQLCLCWIFISHYVL